MSGNGSINIKIAADGSVLRSDLTQDEHELMRMGEALTNAKIKLDDFQRSVAKPMHTAGVEGGIIGGMLGLEGLEKAKEAINEFAESAKKITVESERVGTTAEDWQRLTHAAEESGSSAEEVAAAFGRLSKAIIDPTADGAAAIAKLGLNFKDLRAMSPSQVFDAVAGAIAEIPDPLEKSATAMEIFGKSGAKLVPMINNLQGLKNEATVFFKESIEAGVQYEEGMEKINRGAKGAVAGLMTLVSNAAEAAGALSMGENPGSYFVKKGELEREKAEREAREKAMKAEADAAAAETKRIADDRAFYAKQAADNEQAEILRVSELRAKEAEREEKEEERRHKDFIRDTWEAEKENAANKKRLLEEQAEAEKKLSELQKRQSESVARDKLKAAENEARERVKKAEEAAKKADAAFRDIEANAARLGMNNGAGNAIAMAGETGAATGARRRQIEADALLAEKMKQMAAGERIHLSPQEKRRIQELANEEAAAKAKKAKAAAAVAAAEAKADAAKGALDRFERDRITKQMGSDMAAAKRALWKIQENLRVKD